MDVTCQWCWGWLHDAQAPGMDLPAVPPAKPLRVTVDLDEDTYATIQAEAISHAVTVPDVVRGVLRDWAGRK